MTRTVITKSATIEELGEIRDRIVEVERSVTRGEDIVEILRQLIASRRAVRHLMKRVFVAHIADELQRCLDAPTSTRARLISVLKAWRQPFP